MPYYISNPIYLCSFHKNSPFANAKPVIKNSIFNCYLDTFSFPENLFNIQNKYSYVNTYHIDTTYILPFLKHANVCISSKIQMLIRSIININQIIGKKKRKLQSLKAATSSSGSLSKRKEVMSL